MLETLKGPGDGRSCVCVCLCDHDVVAGLCGPGMLYAFDDLILKNDELVKRIYLDDH